MASSFVDIHPHVIANDDARYPRAPLFGVQSDWSRTRPLTVEQLAQVMDEAGVQKAAIVQASTCYGFDNSYVLDACNKYPGRFSAVCSVDVMQPDAPKTVEKLMKSGLAGLRLFTGGSTAAFDTSSLDDPKSFPTWEFCGDKGLSICIQTGAAGLAQIAGLAKRFPRTRIVLDHFARPEIGDGAPYHGAASLFAMAAFNNIYLKLTPRIFEAVQKGKASPDTFFAKVISAFGANHIAWGSNCPASEGTMKENLELGKRCMASVSAADRSWIFAKTAQFLYPSLADK